MRRGSRYLRTLRPATKVLYGPDEEFEIGGSRVLRSSEDDDVTIVGAGITVHEALSAAETLAGEGISARVIDLYSIKPLDAETLLDAAAASQGRIVTVEDHWPEGGVGDAVLGALAEYDERLHVVKLAVQGYASLGQAGRAARGGRDRRGAHRRGRPRAGLRGRARLSATRQRGGVPRAVRAP